MRQLWQLSPLRWRLGELRTNELCLWELRHHVAKHSYASYFTGLWWLLMPSEKAEERRWRNHLLPKKLTSAFLLDGPQLTPLSHCVTTRSYGPSILSSACPGRASSCWLTRQRAWIVLRKDSNSAAKRSRVRSNVPTRRYGIRHNMLRSFWSFLVPPHVLSLFLCFSGVKSLTSFAWARKADRWISTVVPRLRGKMIDMTVSNQLLPTHITIWQPPLRSSHWARSVTLTRSSRRSKTALPTTAL